MSLLTHPIKLILLVSTLTKVFAMQIAQATSVGDTVDLPASVPGQTHIDADTVHGQLDVELKAQGNVIVTRDSQQILAQWLDYYEEQSRIKAGDHFTLIRPNDRIDGTQLDYFLDSHTGTAEAPVFSSGQPNYRLRGQGHTAEFAGPDQYRIRQARTTTCDAGDDAWYLKSSTLDLDYIRNIGIARNATLVFHGVPIAFTPWMDFPLDSRRKSGFLAPSFRSGSNGAEVALPYYWNIAPNYDATITSHFNAKRGTSLGTQFRYLQPSYSGSAYTRQLPRDHLTQQHRYLWSLQHQQTLAPGLTFGYNTTTVSDNAYFRDFSNSRETIADNVQLLRAAWANYGIGWKGGHASAQIKAQRYQTLQPPPPNFLNSPYAQLPQLTLLAKQNLPRGFSANVSSELTHFAHFSPPGLAPLQNGNRFVAYPSMTWGYERSWGFLRPKLGVHYTQYALFPFNNMGAQTKTRLLPIFSVDSGLFFERDTTALNQHYIQTLEPRVYYVKIPKRSQNQLPNFDTAENDIGLAQLFTENRFSGSDRINNAEQVSLALTSRLINRSNGLETLRATVAQRFYFQKIDVTLNGSPSQRQNTGADMVANLSSDLTHHWRIDSTYQYGANQYYTTPYMIYQGKVNQASAALDKEKYTIYQGSVYRKEAAPDNTKRYSIGVHYHPQPGRLVSMRYLYGNNEPITTNVRGYLRQIDVGVQWPIARKWYAVARDNYSLQDNKHLEQLAGLEYNAGCWSLRLLGQRYLTDLTAKTGFLLQLELKGIGGIGSDPSDILRLAIPGYSKTTNLIQPSP